MANTHVVQKVFSIVDELAAIPKSMPGTFEGNVKDGLQMEWEQQM
jgi:hypothetical protein